MKKAKIIALAVAVVISTATLGLAAPEGDRSIDLERAKPAPQTLHCGNCVIGKKNVYTDDQGRRFSCIPMKERPKYLFEDEDDGFPKGGGA